MLKVCRNFEKHGVFNKFPKHYFSCSQMWYAESNSRTCISTAGVGEEPNENEKNLNYCVNKVKQFDFENFLCTLLLPVEARRSAFAVRAFNIEIAQIRDSINEQLIGEMRMQFWRDSVNAIYQPDSQPPRGNPVISELQLAINKHELSKSWFIRIVDTRRENLAEKPFPTLDALEAYSESTVSSINYLLLETLGYRDVRVDHAASHLGKAQGIATALRAAPVLAEKRRVVLPTDILVKHNASTEDFLREKRTENVREVVFDIASQAHAHLNASRSMTKEVPRQARPALLSAVATHQFLKNLKKVNFDPFHPKIRRRNQLLPWDLWWRNTIKIF